MGSCGVKGQKPFFLMGGLRGEGELTKILFLMCEKQGLRDRRSLFHTGGKCGKTSSSFLMGGERGEGRYKAY